MEPYEFMVQAGFKPGALAEEDSRFGGTAHVLCFGGAGQGYLCSTNGRALAVCPLDKPAPAAPFLIDADAVMANGNTLAVAVRDEVRTQSGKKIGAFVNVPQEGRFPAIGRVFPGNKEVCYEYSVLSIDANLLAKLASAISEDGKLTLLIPLPSKDNGQISRPICVIGLACDGVSEFNGRGIGAIVPLSGKPEAIVALKDYFVHHKEALPMEAIKFSPPEEKK